MRRILALATALILLCALTVAAAPKKQAAPTAETYILPKGLLADTATYNGEKEQAAFDKGYHGNQAMRFESAEYLTVDVSTLAVPFTFSAWVNWQGTTPDQRIFTFQKTGSENYLSLSPWTDTAVVGGATANGVTLLTSCFKEQFLRENYFYPSTAGVSDTLPKIGWHHVAMTVTADAVAVYIDGVEWKAVTLPFTYEELGADTLYIGAAAEGNNRFVGSMQEVALYDSALDAVGIARLAQGAAPNDETIVVEPKKYAPAALPQADTLFQVKTVTVDANGKASFAAASAAFWENPQIASGQTVTGTLTVQNKCESPISLQLTDIVMPAADTAAYQYLSEIKVTIKQDNLLLYDGAYTGLSAEYLSFKWVQMPLDREYTYAITLSRPFASTAETVDTAVDWQWQTELFAFKDNPIKGIPQSGWLLIALSLSAVAVGFSLYWAVIRRPRRIFTVWDSVAEAIKRTLPAKQAEQKTETTEESTEDTE